MAFRWMLESQEEPFDCKTCEWQKERGCNGRVRWHIGPDYVDHCPRKLLEDDYNKSCIVLWQRWRLFGLPFTGGWAEQPAHVAQVIETLEYVYREWVEVRRKQNGS